VDVQTIARRARLPARKVRYVLDQRVLPGLRGRLQKHLAGRPRSFTDMEGYFVACAALLLEGGAQRKTVTEVLARLADMPWPLPGTAAPPQTLKQRVVARPPTALEAMYRAPGEPAEVLVGDGVNLRLRLRGADTGWVEPRSLARLDVAYRPSVTIRLDLAPLRAAFDPVPGG
jgi:hypothetical protein